MPKTHKHSLIPTVCLLSLEECTQTCTQPFHLCRKGIKCDDLTVVLVDLSFHKARFGREGNGEGSYCLLGINCSSFLSDSGSHVVFTHTRRHTCTSVCADATPRHGAGGKPGGLASRQGGQNASVPRVLLVWVPRHARHHLAHLGHHEIHCQGPREVSAPH